MSKLNDDCIRLIIEELYGDKNSLFSCLLVNRLWCKIVVPILWRDPWEFLKRDNEKMFDSAIKFFNIILSYSSEESRNFLKNQGIDISKQTSPLFNYIHFIKHIKHIFRDHNDYDFDNNIYNIYKKQHNNTQKDILEQEIYKLFISKCSSINFLDINGVKQPLYSFSGAKTSLSKLYELHCNSWDDPSLFYGLAEICRSIGKFLIYHENSNPGLAKLIEVQQKIKYLRIILELNKSKSSVEVERELMKKAHQFLYLDIEARKEKNLNFMNNLLSKSINLQELKLSGRNGGLKLIMYISFNHYQDHSESLQMIWKELTNYLNLEIPGQFNEIISQNYPKVKFIEIFAPKRNLESFERILNNFQNLEGLIIDHNCYDYGYIIRLLDILSRSASMDVYKIQFSPFKEEYLEDFLNSWIGRKPIWLHLYGVKNKKLLEKYVKEGVIKKYTYKRIIDDYDQISEGYIWGKWHRKF